MKRNSITVLAVVGTFHLCATCPAFSQESPNVVWEAPTPSGLANSIQGVGWTPSTSARVAFGSTDRWLRVRQSGSGALIYPVLQPHRSGGAVGGDGTLSRWRVAQFTVVRTIGSGYDRVTTTFNFSPNGAYQSAASRSSITIRRSADGSLVRVLNGGAAQGFTPAAFTPDSTRLAAWSASPNRTTLWRISDGIVLMRFPSAAAEEGIGSIRFTPDQARLVTTGYLPYVDADGLWQQVGMIRFWRVIDGALRHSFSEHTGIGVTSPVSWSPDATRFAYGTYEGTAVVALTPAP